MHAPARFENKLPHRAALLQSPDCISFRCRNVGVNLGSRCSPAPWLNSLPLLIVIRPASSLVASTPYGRAVVATRIPSLTVGNSRRHNVWPLTAAAAEVGGTRRSSVSDYIVACSTGHWPLEANGRRPRFQTVTRTHVLEPASVRVGRSSRPAPNSVVGAPLKTTA